MYSKLLSQCSRAEEVILTAIVALSDMLPRPLGEYTRALGEIRKNFLRSKSQVRESRSAGFIDGHQVRASEPWQ